MVGVEDVRLTQAERPSERLSTELAVERVGQLPGEHIATEPVDDGHQVHEAVVERQIRNVRTPHEIGTGDVQVAQQVRINLVASVGDGRLGLGIDRLQTHELHQPLDPFMVHGVALQAEPGRHLGPAVEGRLGILGVDQAHQVQVECTLVGWLVIIRGAG